MATIEDPTLSEELTKMPISDVAGGFQALVGQQIAAYAAGVSDPKMIGRYARGRHTPKDAIGMRLRYGYHLARLIAAAYGKETAKAWMFGANPRLDDEAPAYILRRSEKPDDLRLLVPAARAFVGTAAD